MKVRRGHKKSPNTREKCSGQTMFKRPAWLQRSRRIPDEELVAYLREERIRMANELADYLNSNLLAEDLFPHDILDALASLGLNLEEDEWPGSSSAYFALLQAAHNGVVTSSTDKREWDGDEDNPLQTNEGETCRSQNGR